MIRATRAPLPANPVPHDAHRIDVRVSELAQLGAQPVDVDINTAHSLHVRGTGAVRNALTRHHPAIGACWPPMAIYSMATSSAEEAPRGMFSTASIA